MVYYEHFLKRKLKIILEPSILYFYFLVIEGEISPDEN